MPRIVAGAARGRRIAAPPGRATRPTADRAREALFSALESLLGSLAGRRVADLYAGSGAVGLEALSRGAESVLLVEADAKAVRTIRDNVAAVGLPGAEVVASRVERLLAGPVRTAYDVVFADPPYEVGPDELRAVLTAALDGGWVADGAVLVVERATRDGDWAWPPGVEALRSRRYGEGTLWYGRAAQPAPPA